MSFWNFKTPCIVYAYTKHANFNTSTNPHELLGTSYALKLGCVAYSGVQDILENTVISGWKWKLS
jgi:hypothetical protein